MGFFTFAIGLNEGDDGQGAVGGVPTANGEDMELLPPR